MFVESGLCLYCLFTNLSLYLSFWFLVLFFFNGSFFLSIHSFKERFFILFLGRYLKCSLWVQWSGLGSPVLSSDGEWELCCTQAYPPIPDPDTPLSQVLPGHAASISASPVPDRFIGLCSVLTLQAEPLPCLQRGQAQQGTPASSSNSSKPQSLPGGLDRTKPSYWDSSL